MNASVKPVAMFQASDGSTHASERDAHLHNARTLLGTIVEGGAVDPIIDSAEEVVAVLAPLLPKRLTASD